MIRLTRLMSMVGKGAHFTESCSSYFLFFPVGHLYPSLCVRGLGRPPKKSVIEVCWDIIGGTNLRKRAVGILGIFFQCLDKTRSDETRIGINCRLTQKRRKRISKAADRVTRKLSLFWVLWNVVAFHRVLLGAIWWKSVRFDLKPQWRRWLFFPSRIQFSFPFGRSWT